ncbi:MAG: hypothetical protein JNL70_13425 [Saprospiraceae bacterium]|nr:hypothetical protein [Saprospiraceae bacterium]
MKTPYINTALLLTNFVILFFLLTSQKKAEGEIQSIVRTKMIELVDDKGQKRASLIAYPEGETVFRIMDSHGNIRVKVGGSDEGSGIVLLDDKTHPGFHALSKKNGVSLTLTDENGKQQVLKP